MIGSIAIYTVSFLISLYFMKKYEIKFLNANTIFLKNSFFDWIILIASLTPVVFIATIRYETGTDYLGYLSVYQNIVSIFSPSLIFSYYQEPLNVILYYLSYLLFGSEIGMFFIYSLLTMLFIICGINKYKFNMSITFALFIFYMTFYHLMYNGMRQMLAVSIIFFAYYYVINKKFIKYASFVLIASLFHKSAFLCLFLYFISPKNKNGISQLKSISYYLFIISTPVVVPLIAICIPNISAYLGVYEKYALSDGQKHLNFLLYILPMIIFLIIYRKKLTCQNYKYEFYVKLMFLQIPIQYLGYYVSYVDRLSVYLSISQIVLIPVIIRLISNNKEKYFVTCGLILWYLFYYIVMFIVLKSNGVYPYNFINLF